MNEATLESVRSELERALVGQRFGRIYPLSRRQIAIDFRLPDSRYVFIATEPGSPRIYLIERRHKDLEKHSGNLLPFHLLLKRHLSGAELFSIEKLSDERILVFKFVAENEVGVMVKPSLVVQLTGRSSNLFLLDSSGFIIGALAETRGEGQQVGERYGPPVRYSAEAKQTAGGKDEIQAVNGSISAVLDEQFLKREAATRFKARADAEKRGLRLEIAKREKLVKKLRADLENHGDADKWKRYGDLILANLADANRHGDKILVTDLFDPDQPQIEIEADENLSLTEAAEHFFKRYTKARNAGAEIKKRLETLSRELGKLYAEMAKVEKAINDGNDEAFAADEKAEHPKRPGGKKKNAEFSGARRFVSSDGFEVLVGKKAVDNDHLTFRIAGPVDLWLHAAEYSGSHVVVRNPNRVDIPPRTVLEAAMLAAFYSSGKSQPKAAVHYTQKKFVNKSKGAAAGSVRLASFKTILVKPEIPPALDQKSTTG